MSEPVSIDEIAKRGAIFLGEQLTKIVAVLKNGTEITIAIPETKTVNAGEKEKRVGSWRRRIFAELEKRSEPPTRKAIANAINDGDVRGWFGQAMKALLESGELEEDEHGKIFFANELPEIEKNAKKK